MKKSIISLLLVSAPAVAFAGTILPVLKNANLAGWESKSFEGETQYSTEAGSDRLCVRAKTNGAASGLFREMEVDLNRTPYLNWSWRVDNVYENNNEPTRDGDDYPARVYVVKSGGLLFWRTQAVNYVWSSHQPVGASWPNAFTDHAAMIAVASGSTDTGTWKTHKRNVRDDFKEAFGDDIAAIDAIAIMSDSDNTGQQASACYGDIYFSSD
jgi:hypothetical protein